MAWGVMQLPFTELGDVKNNFEELSVKGLPKVPCPGGPWMDSSGN